MLFSTVKVAIRLFKERVRKFIHPEIYKEQQEQFRLRTNFYSKFLSQGDLVFDVGANMGNRVEVFLELKNKVVAVEPQRFCQQYLKFRFSDKITLKKVALGSRKDKLPMFINSEEHTISSMSESWISSVKEGRFKKHSWDKQEMVDVDTLDNLIASHGEPVFIKIDVEGFELQVLKGLTKPVNMLCFEYATPEQTENAIHCINRIISIDNNYLFNFSIGESNSFVLDNWISGNQLTELINNDVNVLEGFGDIYAKRTKGETVSIFNS